MKAEIYINGVASVSRLLNFNEPLDNTFAPNYKDLIPATHLRRMSRIMRMSSYAGLQALQEAKLHIPQAINIATAYGCLADTEKFLSTLLDNNEEFSNPSAFINSTHNTLAGKLAILLGAKGQNFTFVHSENAFENALIDAAIGMDEGSFDNVLVGGVDENIEILKHIYSQISSHRLGEGSAFLSLSKEKQPQSMAKINAIKLSFDSVAPEEFIAKFFQEYNISENEIDLVLSGKDKVLDIPQINYKETSGEYPTVTAFACAWAASIISNQHLPRFIKFKLENISKVLIHNIFPNGNQSIILMSHI